MNAGGTIPGAGGGAGDSSRLPETWLATTAVVVVAGVCCPAGRRVSDNGTCELALGGYTCSGCGSVWTSSEGWGVGFAEGGAGSVKLGRGGRMRATGEGFCGCWCWFC